MAPLDDRVLESVGLLTWGHEHVAREAAFVLSRLANDSRRGVESNRGIREVVVVI